MNIHINCIYFFYIFQNNNYFLYFFFSPYYEKSEDLLMHYNLKLQKTDDVSLQKLQ